MRVAVLGANGFIGSRIVESFHLEQRAEVRPVVRRVPSLVRTARFRLDARVADGRDRPALRAAFEGCDAVVHAIAGDPTVILGTLAPVYAAAEEAGVRRLIYLSSASVHGQAPEPGTTELTPLTTRHPIAYNAAKVRAERRLRALRSRGRVELVILRPGIVLGPRSYWIRSFADALLEGEAYLLDRGRGICNAIYVDNLVHAIDRAMRADGVDGEVFLLGDTETVTWADVYRPIAEAMGFELEGIPEGTLPPRAGSREDLLRRVRGSEGLLRLSKLVPERLRRGIRRATLGESETVPDRWRSPVSSPPVATRETALLYRCAVKLPFEKATKLLGYRPAVSFELGCRKTVAWLAFAGYPVIASGARGEVSSRSHRAHSVPESGFTVT